MKWPPILTAIAGFVAVSIAAGVVLVAPCGPGCEWPVFIVTLIYSIALLTFRFKVPSSRYTAIILCLVSVILLCERLHTRRRVKSKLRARVQELQMQAIELGTTMQRNTEQIGAR